MRQWHENSNENLYTTHSYSPHTHTPREKGRKLTANSHIALIRCGFLHIEWVAKFYANSRTIFEFLVALQLYNAEPDHTHTITHNFYSFPTGIHCKDFVMQIVYNCVQYECEARLSLICFHHLKTRFRWSQKETLPLNMSKYNRIHP